MGWGKAEVVCVVGCGGGGCGHGGNGVGWGLMGLRCGRGGVWCI